MNFPNRLSANFDDRPPGAVVDMLVLHYTGMATVEAALERLRDPMAKVSAHYLIGEQGEVISLVAEEHRAWHAGEAFWRGNTDINSRSIGIELVNPGHEFGYRTFTETQMAALRGLAADILGRHPVPARNVVAHSDVAPRRRTDPGELFDWRWLAAGGIGLWPGAWEARRAAADEVRNMLAEYGYETGDLGKTVTAFQRRFRRRQIDGVADAETVGRLDALLRLLS
ncbi:MAG: N-acetylmuramoyl-L-alanine amidase [Rhodospirillales bacterium]|nr:N-acetylmuramoyl-L-alanine amidase [Rhodospirillales bacterium]HIJ42893.1 N-acetylmuramoyl-L-alanine amidase [Rhodospirillaceae bacterium]HIJ44709.1 N-acetylmuramoyl-L-alanine amidase [Rhodospirillaceae bacterium]HIJ92259.1 N-acetylmuramoyl-L-alanine amidase [Rhodospirillaceae bacterium]